MKYIHDFDLQSNLFITLLMMFITFVDFAVNIDVTSFYTS